MCATAKTSSGRTILVQAGAFKRAEGASSLAAELSDKGYAAHTVASNDFHRVVLGPFSDMKGAATVVSGLQRDGYSGYIRTDLPFQSPTPVKPGESDVRPAAGPTIELSQLRLPSLATIVATDTTDLLPRRDNPPQVTDLPHPPKMPVPPSRAAAIRRETPARFELPLVADSEGEVESRTVWEPLEALVSGAPDLEPQPPVNETVVRLLLPANVALAPAIAPVSAGLRLSVLAGDGAANNVEERRSAHDPVVQVLDSESRPVAGAVVTFTLPDRGASGSFADGSRILAVLTDEQGRATGKGLTPNGVEGTMPIQIAASHRGQSVSRRITQTNFAIQRRGASGAKIGIFSALAAGAAVGIVKALEGRSQGSPSVDPTIRGTATVGTPTVGAP